MAQHFTQPPAHFTDASLIRALEENGIGRPSTYAPTVSTILDREYVVKEGKYLRMTPLGSVVNDLMCQRFPKIVDVKFTANMEKELDEVESGDKNWKALLREFYGDFDQNLNQVEKDMEGVYIKVPDEVSEEKCDICGRNMVVKTGRFGRFLACPGYPECTIHQAPGCPDAGPLPQVRRTAHEAHRRQPKDRQAIYLLLLRPLHCCRREPALRLPHLGRTCKG